MLNRTKPNFFPSSISKAKLGISAALIWFVLFIFLGASIGCKNSKLASETGAKAKTSWLARLFGKGKKKGNSESTSYTTKEVSKVIGTARSYRGTPHVTGGVSRLGIDCSALMMVSFASAGLKIPRTANQQSQFGRPVPKTNLKPGDLVFFSDRKIGSGITHVGLVTEISSKGEIKFIHTSSRLGVTENLLSTDYFSRTFTKATRPF